MSIIMRSASRAFQAYRGEVLTIGEYVIFARPIYAEKLQQASGPLRSAFKLEGVKFIFIFLSRCSNLWHPH